MLRKIKREKSQIDPVKETTNKTEYFLLIYDQGVNPIYSSGCSKSQRPLGIPWLKPCPIKGLKDNLKYQSQTKSLLEEKTPICQKYYSSLTEY